MLMTQLITTNNNDKVCAIFAHPDDELNMLGELRKYDNLNVYYLTCGEEGWRHSGYYGDINVVKNKIKGIRKKETKRIANHFGFKYRIMDLPDINNDTKTPWDSVKLYSIVKKLGAQYDKIYVIGNLEREHHQHKQIADVVTELYPNKVVYCNYVYKSESEVSSVINYKLTKYNKEDLDFFVNTLKSQGTMKDAIDCIGYITYVKVSK